MPRRPRLFTRRFVFHILNRAVQGVTLFERLSDYEAFTETLMEALRRFPVRLLAYCVMPNHWHLVVWPETDESLSAFMHWLTSSHARHWRDARLTRGRGAVYQGRFKAIAVQHDAHLLRLCLYVKRNAVRGRLVTRASEWPWSSASPLACGPNRPGLAEWPIKRPPNWDELLEAPEPPRDLHELRAAIRHGRHFGSRAWELETIETLGWRTGLRRPGRPPSRAGALATASAATET